MALSDTKLRSLLNKERAELVTLSDRDSLSVRVSPKGKIVFQYRYRFNGKGKRYDIGSYPSVSLAEARATIPELKGIVEAGKDVKVVKDAERALELPSNKVTLDDCVELFLTKRAIKLREGTYKNYSYTLNKHAVGAFSQPIEDITVAEWYAYFDTIEQTFTPHMSNTVCKQIKTCLRFCCERQLIKNHNLNQIKTNSIGTPAMVGDRTPSLKEIKLILKEFNRSQCLPSTVNVVKLIILTGARCSEVREMQRQDIDMDTGIWTVPRDKSKTDTKIVRPLGPKALELVKSQIDNFGELTSDVFPNSRYSNPITPQTINKMCRAIVKKMDIEKWSVHDFRRSLSTILTDNRVQLHVTEKMLGHKLTGILSVYNKSQYIDEQREAYEIWEKLIGF